MVRNRLIMDYFEQGYTYKEIIHFLQSCNSIFLSERHLKRILKGLGLKRKCLPQSDINEIVESILKELNGSGSCLGYKSLWRRIKNKYCLNVKRDIVMKILQEADPIGVEARSKARLKRRQYIVPGPNFLWHVDGYDKLKPFGFAIHGCIDGYSRKIIWLKVASSNNNTKYISWYFLNALKDTKCVPTLLRSDRGTENSIIALLQKNIRRSHSDCLAGDSSYIAGRSTSNQRIESYWSQMRRLGGNWWISFFKDLRDQHLFNDGDQLQVECLRYCFSHLIQKDLDLISQEWNTHRIRRQKNTELPARKPNCLYYFPEAYGSKNYGKLVHEDEIKDFLETHALVSLPYNPKFKELVNIIAPNITMLCDVNASIETYTSMIAILSKL